MGEQRRIRAWAVPLAIGAAVLLVAVLLIVLVVLPSGQGTPGPPPTATATERPAPPSTKEPTREEVHEPPTPTPEPVLETTQGTDVTAQGVLGEVKVEYPIHMSPGSSDLLILSIYIPPQLASLAPVSVARVEIPPDAPEIVGEHDTHYATILVAKTMRVELSSPTFTIDPHYPPLQDVDIRHVTVPTMWAWDIAAPGTPGHHVLTTRVYLGHETTPSWVRGFEIDVRELAPTPVPTRTPGPTPAPQSGLQRLAKAISDNASTLLLVLLIVLLILIGSSVAVYLALRKQKSQEGLDSLPVAGGHDSMPIDEPAYDLAAIRDLLQAAFTADTLPRFCLDRPTFRPIIAEFGPGHGLDDMVDCVIEYCETHLLWPEFLAEVEKENPRQYQRYERTLRRKNP